MAFPELGLEDIEAKVDTGAYRSALHCHDMEVVVKKKVRVLQCRLLDPSHPNYDEKELHFKEFTETVVKNSFGQVEERFAVKIKIKIGDALIKTDFTLTDRSEMKYPVLLGRKFLKNRFLVDVSKLNVLNKKEEETRK